MASWGLIGVQGSFGQGLLKTMWNDLGRIETLTRTTSLVELGCANYTLMIAIWDCREKLVTVD